jgi:NhaB family Na+:H+ antiporter
LAGLFAPDELPFNQNASMTRPLAQALGHNFLGRSPFWYKAAIVSFLIVNPVAYVAVGPFATGWLLVGEFIFTLAMSLKCYPLQPGGLLALEAVLIGMASPVSVYEETLHNLPVLLLMIFMVAGIYFLKEMLLFVFSRLLIRIQSKTWLSFAFCAAAAFLSAFLDALTVIAVIMAVGFGFYAVFHRVASGKGFADDHDCSDDTHIRAQYREDLDRFRLFLCSLMMHAAMGTALGGVTTLVGEPQNLLIGHVTGWQFMDFFREMAPVSLPVLATGLAICIAMEKLRWFGYGVALPQTVRQVLEAHETEQQSMRDLQARARLIVQAMIMVFLIVALGFHWAEVGIIGLAVIVLATAFNGVTEEHRLGRAFTEALPFTALLVVFFAIVAVIHTQNLFSPVIQWALSFEGRAQLVVFYMANGLLSMVSDNVFVATIYITEAKAALVAGAITPDQFDLLAVAINTGTNIPSVATPNGQAAFLFLLTSALAPLIRLSYLRMCWMALPYTVTMSTAGLAAVWFFLA